MNRNRTTKAKYRALAQADKRVNDELEVDDNARVLVSGDGTGAFVQAWLWIPSPNDDIE